MWDRDDGWDGMDAGMDGCVWWQNEHVRPFFPIKFDAIDTRSLKSSRQSKVDYNNKYPS